MRTSRRCAIAGLVTVAAAAMGAAPGLARSTKTAASQAPECQSHQLVTTLTSPSGTAGSFYYKLQFANLGSACTLTGFPGVSAVGGSGKQIGKAAGRSGSATKTVTLPAVSGTRFFSATATLRIVDVLNYPAARCNPVLAYGLRVYPPDQKAGLAVPLPFAACSSTSTTTMTIGAIKAS